MRTNLHIPVGQVAAEGCSWGRPGGLDRSVGEVVDADGPCLNCLCSQAYKHEAECLGGPVSALQPPNPFHT